MVICWLYDRLHMREMEAAPDSKLTYSQKQSLNIVWRTGIVFRVSSCLLWTASH